MKQHILALLACLLISGFSCRVPEVTSITGTSYAINDSSAGETDSTIYYLIQPYRDSLKRSMDELLAVSAWGMSKELPEGRLGNYCTDACLRQVREISRNQQLPEPVVCILNHGGLRASFPSGAIRLGNVFEVMPFENELLLMTLNGVQLDSIIQFIATKGGAPVAGLRFTIDRKNALEIRVGSEKLSPEESYVIIASDFIANGGDGFPVMKNVNEKVSTGLKVRDALIRDLKVHLLNNDTLKVNPDGRIKML